MSQPESRTAGRGGLVLGAGLVLLQFAIGLLRRGRKEPGVDPEDLRAGHELSDVSARAIALFAIGLLVTLGIAFAAISALQVGISGYPFQLGVPANGLADQPSGAPPPEPRLQTVPGQELQALRATQEARLHSYQWLNRSTGTVRIPIERAMDLLAERGLPSRAPAASSQQQEQHSTVPADASSGRAPAGAQP